jgi:hypothetical protein
MSKRVSQWYYVWCPELSQFARQPIMASSPARAAEEWCRLFDWNTTDYAVAKSVDPVKVYVEDGKDQSPSKLPVVVAVTARSDPAYTGTVIGGNS